MDYKEKAEAYEEAYKRVAIRFGSNVADELFPELAESEDEKIKKTLIHYVENWKTYNPNSPFDDYAVYTSDRDECDRILAWLEKQGKSVRVEAAMKELEEKSRLFAEAHKGESSDEILAEMRGEQKPFDYQNANIQQKDFAPKDEPKFKVGDWITNGDYTWEVTDITVLDYVLRAQNGNIVDDTISYTDEQFNLWTIQDAKDGDVLCYKDEVFLYKHDIKDWKETSFGGMVYYCCYDGKRFITDSFYSLTEQDKIDIHPATKEQRKQLEKAMTASGYEWDAENKELTKIQQQ